MNKTIKLASNTIIVSIAVFILSTSLFAQQSQSEDYKKAKAEIMAAMGTVPQMLKNLPDHMLASHWEWFKSYNNPNSAIPPKYAELIGLAVSSQIPCDYCVYAHTILAKSHGATEAELKEAVANAAKTRFLSTIANGFPRDLDKFKKDWDQILTYMKKQSEAKK